MVAPSFNIIELCAGGGMLGVGVDAALRHLGCNPRAVGYVERDSYAAAVLVARMEDAQLDHAPIWDDVATFDGGQWRGVVDCVVAGIPCQGNSLAGKRLLGDDPRNLWPATRRLLRNVGCDWFFLENVYGFLVPDDGREAPISRVLGELGEDGWDAEWDVVSAADVGASHERKRVFVLAKRIGAGRGARGNTLRIRRASGRGKLAHGGGRLPAETGSMVNAERAERWPDDPARCGADGPHNDARRQESTDGIAASGTGIPARAVDDTIRISGGEWTGRERVCDRREEIPTRTLGHLDGAGCGQVQPSAQAGRQDADGRCENLPVFAPFRNDYLGWVRLLRADPSLVPALRRPNRSGVSSGTEATEPAICGTVDGLAGRVEFRGDRLRLCGNGVVWQAAAEAFTRLWMRLMK